MTKKIKWGKWIEWKGLSVRCPVEPNAIIGVELKNGHCDIRRARDVAWWERRGNPGDVVAYRIARPATKPKKRNNKLPKPLTDAIRLATEAGYSITIRKIK